MPDDIKGLSKQPDRGAGDGENVARGLAAIPRGKFWATVWLSVAAILMLLWLLRAGGLPVLPDAAALSSVSGPLIAVYVLIWVVVLLIRSARWIVLLRPLDPEVGLARTIRVHLVGLAAVVLIPFRMGEAVRPALIAKRGNVSAWGAAGTVAAERVIDGMFLSLVLLGGLALAPGVEPYPDHIGDLPVPVALIPRGAMVAAVGFSVACVVMILVHRFRERARAIAERLVAPVSDRAAAWVGERVERVATGLRFPPWRDGSMARFLAATAVYWFTNIAGLWLMLDACGFADASFGQAAVVMGVLALGILVPAAPGFFGTFQLSVYAGLALHFGLDGSVSRAAAFSFLLYVVQVGAILVCGVVAGVLEHFAARR